MTREEAINILKCDISADKQGIEYCHDEVGIEALEMAIKALEQEQSGDLISRQAVNTLVDELARAISDERSCMSRGRSTATIMQNILDLPSVNPQEPCSNCCNGNQIEKAKLCQKSYLAGMEHKQELTDRIEYGTDGNAYKLWISNGKEYETKEGHWKKENPPMVERYPFCSECGFVNPFENALNYCPNCGAKMESEDKE